ncbi:MAG: AI-2E family transporter [Nonlabens sp.]|nr:AI-2E family transporter [Nonlabens sp.]MDP5099842.1 AI-2E family transporter [Nonlabens sp.]
MKSKIPNTYINQVLIIALLIVTALLFTQKMIPYLGGVFAAVALYSILVGFQRKLEKRKWNKSLAAAFLLVLSTVIILIPIGLMGLMLTSKITDALDNKEQIIEYVQQTLGKIEAKVGFDIAKNVDTDSMSGTVSDFLSGVANSGLNYFITLGVMYFILYYMLVERKKWQNAAKEYLPFSKKNIKTLGKESLSLVKSNAIGIPLVALLQGIVAFIGFLIFGVENPFFWFAITAIGSMIPFVGTAIGVVPATIILIAQDQPGMALGFLIYGVIVIGSTDNLFRLIVQRKLANMHPLETLIGVVIGVPLFGFMGLIFGPVVVSLFLLIMRMYKLEYKKNNKPKKLLIEP